MDRLGLRRPTIPVAYPRLLLQAFAARELDQKAVRDGTGLRTALRVNAHYFRTRNRQYTLHYAEHGDGATLTLAGIQAHPVLQHHLMYEFVLTALAAGLPMLTGRAVPPLELRFAWAEPDYVAPYREHLPPLRFGADANALWIARDALDWPLTMADDIAHRQALAQVEREYATVRHEEGDWIERVRAELMPGPQGYPDPDQLAERLHVSTRTLRRRLAEAGATYRRLIDEARYRDAKHMLRASDLELGTIAARLAYGDPANFTRAFRKWAGITPSAYRRQAWTNEKRDD